MREADLRKLSLRAISMIWIDFNGIDLTARPASVRHESCGIPDTSANLQEAPSTEPIHYESPDWCVVGRVGPSGARPIVDSPIVVSSMGMRELV